jgi:Domain of unknown function (DUF4383)
MKAPRTPVQSYALVVGAILVIGGLIALVTGSTDFGTVSGGAGQNFIIWNVSGWETILYMGLGALGVLSANRVENARTFALTSGLVFAAMAIWGWIDGDDVVSIFAIDTTDNITYSILGAAGLLLGMTPKPLQGKVGLRPANRGHGGHTTQA